MAGLCNPLVRVEVGWPDAWTSWALPGRAVALQQLDDSDVLRSGSSDEPDCPLYVCKVTTSIYWGGF